MFMCCPHNICVVIADIRQKLFVDVVVLNGCFQRIFSTENLLAQFSKLIQLLAIFLQYVL